MCILDCLSKIAVMGLLEAEYGRIKALEEAPEPAVASVPL
jgi:hypothetical protein